jgi:hypothetical protein
MNKRNASAAKNKSSNTDDNDQAGTTEHQWVKDYRLIPWDNLTLFDEYLEMSKFGTIISLYQLIDFIHHFNSNSIRIYDLVHRGLSSRSALLLLE